MLSNPLDSETILCVIRHGGTKLVACGPSCPPLGPEGQRPLNPATETCCVSWMSYVLGMLRLLMDLHNAAPDSAGTEGRTPVPYHAKCMSGLKHA